MAAKKKVVKKKRSGTRKSAVRKTPARTARRKKAATIKKRPAGKRKSAKKKKSAVKRKSVKKPARKKSKTSGRSTTRKAAAARRKVKKPKTLGRPRLPSDAKLDLVFQKDYQAREIFGFLRVQTLRELEEWSPDEIIEKLTGPMVQTVQRIRKALALSNRCLANDLKFALDFKSELQKRK